MITSGRHCLSQANERIEQIVSSALSAKCLGELAPSNRKKHHTKQLNVNDFLETTQEALTLYMIIITLKFQLTRGFVQHIKRNHRGGENSFESCI